MQCEAWDEDPKWAMLPLDLRREFEEADEITNPSDDRYDPVLMIWLESTFEGATNEYLAKLLREATADAVSVHGTQPEMTPCPCCGLCTLSGRGDYEICRVCWWEDDGQDNERADTVMGGPNYHLSLTQGRVNYLREGISDPSRLDLRGNQEPAEKYRVGRVFEMSPDSALVLEPESEWSADALPEPPTVLRYGEEDFASTARQLIALGRPILFELTGKAMQAVMPHIVSGLIPEPSSLGLVPRLQPLLGVLMLASAEARAVTLEATASAIKIGVEGAQPR